MQVPCIHTQWACDQGFQYNMGTLYLDQSGIPVYSASTTEILDALFKLKLFSKIIVYLKSSLSQSKRKKVCLPDPTEFYYFASADKNYVYNNSLPLKLRAQTFGVEEAVLNFISDIFVQPCCFMTPLSCQKVLQSRISAQDKTVTEKKKRYYLCF